jgi:hypothetical protein
MILECVRGTVQLLLSKEMVLDVCSVLIMRMDQYDQNVFNQVVPPIKFSETTDVNFVRLTKNHKMVAQHVDKMFATLIREFFQTVHVKHAQQIQSSMLEEEIAFRRLSAVIEKLLKTTYVFHVITIKKFREMETENSVVQIAVTQEVN